jgi:hypothetical protein
MFSKISERRMLRVRALLLAAWLVLIASMFWDPVTPVLTRPDQLSSPFRVQTPGMTLQGGRLHIDNTPYQMGARIFWTMLVPIVPLFLMVFGHEAWRRICPLSMASQLPKLLGLGRKRKSVQRRSGRVEHKIVLVTRGSWLERNSWYLQFGLLFAGLNARLLFANSSRVGLALLLLGVISAAVAVGWLFGGKSWCNFFCPVNIVQKIYTEPRGLLESQAHVTRLPVTQAMCRTPSPAGDKSLCVGCTASCGDIDLERSYWDTIALPARRHVYYMFFGLIIGFYGYYYIYSGTWDYYFSGIWTHEAGAPGRALDSGVFLFGRAWPIPKLVAAPLTLALACACSLALGLGLESAYRRLRSLRGGEIPDGEVAHHCLSVSAFVSINTFYFFGGRPNINLMPMPVVRVLDLAIVALTTLWLLQALQRTPMKYRREGMAAHLLEQLKKLKVDVGRYLEGRTLDQLKPDEVYVLTKVLAPFTHEQKLQAYSRILDEAVSTGGTGSPGTLRMLSEVRAQMDISEEEHLALLDRMVANPEVTAVLKDSSHERAAGRQKYEEMLGGALAGKLEAGKTLEAALADPDVQATARLLAASLQITPKEHAEALKRLREPDGAVCTLLQRELEEMKLQLSCRFFLQARRATTAEQQGPAALLIERIEQRKRTRLPRLLSLLRALGDTDAAMAFAHSLAALDGQLLTELLAEPAEPGGSASWEDSLPPVVAAQLLGQAPANPRAPPAQLKIYNFHNVIAGGLDAAGCLKPLLRDNDPVIQAVVLAMAARVDPDLGREFAGFLAGRDAIEEPLLTEMIDRLNGGGAAPAVEERMAGLRLALTLPDGRRTERVVEQNAVTVGSGLANDVAIASDLVAPYHLRLSRRDDGHVAVARFDDAPLYVDGQRISDSAHAIESPALLAFCGTDRRGPELQVSWDRVPAGYVVQRVDGVTKLVWLRACEALQAVSLSRLARIASQAEVRRYALGTTVSCDAPECAYVLHGGEMTPTEGAHRQIGSGALLTSIAMTDAARPGAPSFIVASESAVVLAVADAEHVRLLTRAAWAARRGPRSPLMPAAGE